MSPNGYWGTAPTGRVHIGYILPMFAIIDLIAAGCNITIFLADIHAFLDSIKSPLDIELRTQYYQIIIIRIIEIIEC